MENTNTNPSEPARVEALKKYGILDTPSDSAFDDLTALAAKICDTPMSLISLVDEDRQWFKSKYGLAIDQTARQFSFCSHAIEQAEVFVVEDARRNDKFKDNPLITGDPNIAFYTGVKLENKDGFALGTLCVLDRKPRKLSSHQIECLKLLSRSVLALIENNAEQRAQAKQAKFLSAIMGAVPTLVSYLDQDLRYQYANAAYKEWFGLAAEDMVGRKTRDVFGEDFFELGRQHLEGALSGKLVTYEIKLPYRVGGALKPKTVRATYIPDFADDGTVCGIFVIVSDLSSEVSAQNALISKERVFQRVVDAIPVMISHWDRNERNVNANLAYANYFARSPEEIRGMALLDLLGEQNYKVNKIYVEGVLEGRPQTFERDIRLKNGETPRTLANYIPDYVNGSVEGFFVTIYDVTPLKRLEDERRTLEAQLVAASKMAELGEMAGGIAHEINTPLGIILGTAEYLKILNATGELKQEQIDSNLTKICETTERIAKIITGLRAFSRNAENDPLAKTNLGVIMESTLALCREKFKNAGIELKLDMDFDVVIDCREAQLSQVLVNLLSNAYDAVADLEDKWVSIRLKKYEHWVQIEVVDSGSGIPDAIAEKLMLPFFTTKEVGRGTGLGLSVSLGLIQSHGGDLSYLRDRLNTTFRITLPIVAE